MLEMVNAFPVKADRAVETLKRAPPPSPNDPSISIIFNQPILIIFKRGFDYHLRLAFLKKIGYLLEIYWPMEYSADSNYSQINFLSNNSPNKSNINPITLKNSIIHIKYSNRFPHHLPFPLVVLVSL